MNDGLWHVHLAGGQKIKWALDEDLRWAKEALKNRARFVPLPAARIVHAAWWPALMAAGLGALRGKTVLSFADNPPAFYLTQPGFAEAAGRVDLWIARSREALAQFHALGLHAEYAPYCVDGATFHPLPKAKGLRDEYDIPADAFVIGNFHRDSEGSDLNKPKAQKGPDIFLQIAVGLHRAVPQTLVLLAGPRRHWLRKELARAGVPFRFVGRPVEDADDYEVNILDRGTLNRLYHILDVCVVSSRWEGGPHSVLEALFAGRPVISTPVGIARDLLPEGCLYRSIEDAVELLRSHAASRTLLRPSDEARTLALSENTPEKLRACLGGIYQKLPQGGVGFFRAARSAGQMLARHFWGEAKKAPAAKLLGEMKLAQPALSFGDQPLAVETPLETGSPDSAQMRLAECASFIAASRQ